MKRIFTLLLLITAMISTEATAQESYGRTLNLGVGIGYYGYVGRSIPVINANYEFDVANNFTIAPSISFYSYSRDFKYGNKHNGHRYSETVVPIGAKFTYYFDEILGANENWDFYLAGTLGFAFRSVRWDDGYNGDGYKGGSPLYTNLHIGTEYHFNNKIGMFLDLSTGVSTLGIAIHH